MKPLLLLMLAFAGCSAPQVDAGRNELSGTVFWKSNGTVWAIVNLNGSRYCYSSQPPPAIYEHTRIGQKFCVAYYIEITEPSMFTPQTCPAIPLVRLNPRED